MGALEVTAGIILFLVALRPVMEQYAPREARSEAHGSGATPAAVPASALAISPLAFPTIVTPYGVAVLIMLVTLRGGQAPIALQILGVTVGARAGPPGDAGRRAAVRDRSCCLANGW